ncbi:transcriptional antiterminator RfaH [Roseivivax lentus]|uniref:Transcriptional antiterminator RfaH n=1 Tax=Roseivivax lentus TaxID=633194 RepID=A0A1N7P6A1_9RHOB|nr:transcription termination/antitermination NusG family protein [Roseivivax lentus]SIT06057.1 transcriptional antiterminator RfaH [Roseivivax lentus]
MLHRLVHETSSNWFAAQLRPNGLSIAERNLSRQGFSHFTPKRLETRRQSNRVVTTPRPLFPGYIFVQFDPLAPQWRALNATRGLTRVIVNDPRHPTPLPDDFMAALMERSDESGLLKPPPELKPGDRVRVVAGPMADLVSRIERMDDNARIQLLMHFMGQESRLSVSMDMVEKVDD